MKSIKSKLILILCVIIVISCSGLGLISYNFSKQALVDSVEHNLITIAEKSSQLIEERVNKELGKLEVIAGRTRITDPDNTTEDKLDALREEISRNGYQLMDLIDTHGQAVSTGNKKYDLSHREYFKRAMNGQSTISDLLVSAEDGSLIVVYATPIKSNGDITGVLVAIKEAISFSDVIKDITVGETGYAYVVNDEGMIVADKDVKRVNNVNLLKEVENDKKSKKLKELLDKMIAKEQGSGSYTYNGSEHMIGYSPINNTNWSIGITAPLDEVLSELDGLRSSTLMISGVILIISLFFIYLVGAFITKPLVDLSKNIDIMAQFDLRENNDNKILKHKKRKDEIGFIFNSISVMQNNFISLIKKITETVNSITESSASMSLTTQQSAQAAEEVATTISEIAKGATDQAKDTEKGSETVYELGDLIEKEHECMEEVSTNSDKVIKLADEGLIEINELKEKTDLSKEATIEIFEVIKKTNESSKKISKASTMIASIAEQTNLLALNAAIEAARAGDAGKGFAVVADEIRTLAEQSTESTKEIDLVVNELITNAGQTVKRMEEVYTIVNHQINSVDVTEGKYKQIVEAISSTDDSIDRLNSIGVELQKKKENILDVIQNLSAIAEENAASTEEAAASTEEQSASLQQIASTSESLAELAAELNQEASKFQL
ncbi:methyl-accepting chemotaxis protein [Vallitalea guaymasensis]|uniref:Cache 3/Cache 2 fusion domain-containing protein n=1 Tax=Vallitalea guaymasensis TaxID=1185412 RepID=A0A8J8M731_9FIRM|nr:methyl-accepting chemotaxis protein [Vallitalea guaymasensis]QUH27541.1 Cache 3/Cache 2 fusion domain-containing protein [Vallitalea guaymasensis]